MFKELVRDEKLYMGNTATADIKGEGDVIWKRAHFEERALCSRV